MRTHVRAAGVLLAALLIGGLLPGGGATAGSGTAHPAIAAAAAKPGAKPAAPAGRWAGPTAKDTRPHTVTLVTGDRVTVVDNQPVRVVRGPGRSGVTFVTATVNGHLRIFPSDTLPLLRAGRLDPRLFDVTALVGFGYHEGRPDLPLIITGDPAVTRGRAAGVAKDAKDSRPVPGGTAVHAAKSGLPNLWQNLKGGLNARSAGLSKVWLDGIRRPALAESVPQIGAPTAWAAGYTGTGVKVAIVDTGIDATHPDLAGRIAAARDFTGENDDRDLVGHGTHVAATVGSNDSRYKGVAPGARLLAARVCSPNVGCPDSAILAGMQWSVEQGAKVVNMSLGATDTPEQDPIEAAVEDLTARFGALFVLSAGNDGADSTINSAGSADAALTVGAVTKSDALADFSSRGPRLDGALKPDITAPGQDIVAARGKDARFGKPGDLRAPLSGTSMAAPHVAGAAAILAQIHPDWTPAMLKAALMGSARPGSAIGIYGQGAGRVDVARAVGQSILAEPASVSFGRQLWPHTDDAPVTRTVTYRNLGTAAVTLDLSLPAGLPAGMFRLSAANLTVPAGGTAAVTLTADTRVASADGFFGGHLAATARGGTAAVSTPFAVDKEVESYDVRLTHLDRTGQPTGNFFTVLTDPAARSVIVPFAGADTVRVPKGRYVALTAIAEADPEVSTLLVEPELNADRPRTLTLDARAGKPIAVSVPQADGQFSDGAAFAVVDTPDRSGSMPFGTFTASFAKTFIGQPDPGRRNPLVWSLVSGMWTKAGSEPIDSPYLTQVAFRERGRLMSGLRKQVAAGDLATVDARFAGHGSPDGLVRTRSTWPGSFVGIGFGLPVRLPGRRVEYYNTADDVQWSHSLDEGDIFTGEVGNTLDGPPTTLAAGRRYTEHRNRAVYGPGFREPPLLDGGWLTRRGDTMTLLPTLFNDQLDWAGFLGKGTARLALERDGRPVFDEALPGVRVDVPAGEAGFRLTAEQTREAPSALSTKVSCVWTFRSGTVAGSNPVALPVSAVRFTPPLDERNAAPAGRLFAVPFEVRAQAGSAAGAVRRLTLDVSYDDGATWQRVPVLRFGQRGVGFVTHPAGAGFVSLRASLTDTAGNTLDQTVLRAYRTAA